MNSGPLVRREYLRASAAPGPGFFWGWGLAFGALGVALLQPVLTGGFFADDWELYLARPASHIAGAFLETRPYETYRPIQLVLVASSQALLGDTTLPVHLLNLALHVGLALLVLRALLTFGASPLGAVLGGLYVTVSQLAASAVGGNDTISLTLGTLAGSSALLLLRPFSQQRPARPALAAAAFALALFAKESSLGYLPLLGLLAWLLWAGSPGGARKAILWSAGYGLLALGYLALRARAGGVVPDFASGAQVRAGMNVFSNAALLAAAALVPLPTTQIFVGLSEHRWPWPVAGALSALAVGAFLAWGLMRDGKLRLVAGFALASVVLLSPVLVLNHVSELYAYALLPFVALLFGWSAGVLVTRGGAERIAALVLVAGTLSANAWAAHQDARGMARSGELAAELMPQVLEHVRALPPGGAAVLVDPPFETPNYSAFQMSGFRGVLLAPRQIGEMTGRTDVRVLGVAPGEPLPDPCRGCAFLTLAPGNRVVPMP